MITLTNSVLIEDDLIIGTHGYTTPPDVYVYPQPMPDLTVLYCLAITAFVLSVTNLFINFMKKDSR